MSPDLRKTSTEAVTSRVQQTLATDFDPRSEVRKRRSLGYATNRGTWVRIEVRDQSRSLGQGWGIEEAAIIQGVAMPAWIQGVSWIDHDLGVMWRADETECITDSTVKSAGILTTKPELPESWWEAFNASLTALATHTTTRTATPGLQPITQERFTSTIAGVFPGIDTTITEWCAAHADLAWPNLTAPACYLLDWEDWGMAPRGWDGAMLWSESLAVPALAARVYQERQADLDSRTGKLVQLYHCAKLIAATESRSGALFEPAQEHATELLTDLQT